MMRLLRDKLPTITAGVIALLIFAFGALRYDHFASPFNVANLFGDYAYLGIAAIGSTYVIISGGIDLSVGSFVAFTSILVAYLVGPCGMHPLFAALISLIVGAILGAIMGLLIGVWDLPPFMVTLAGMFAIRALGFLIRSQSMSINHPFYNWVSGPGQIQLGGGARISLSTIIYIALAILAAIALRSTRFGRNVFAIGGNEKSARVMGVRVVLDKILIYTFAGICSALAGFVFTLFNQSGDPASAVGMELDVIAAVVIGGTLLTGGVGSILGTMIGVAILGLIRLVIDFQGNLNAAWTSIAIGILLLVFVGLQNGMMRWLSARTATAN